KGGGEVSYVKPDKNGLIAASKVIDAIKDDTALISIMYVNNEIGTIKPITEIGKQIEKLNKDRNGKIYFHTDAVQAAPVLELNTKYLHVDMLTLSSHKIGGPKGGGALFVKSGTPIHSIINGGGQEQGLRSGTQNVYTAVGLALALEEVNNQLDKENQRLTQLQSKLVDAIRELKGTVINGSLSHRSPMNINFSWKSYTS